MNYTWAANTFPSYVTFCKECDGKGEIQVPTDWNPYEESDIRFLRQYHGTIGCVICDGRGFLLTKEATELLHFIKWATK